MKFLIPMVCALFLAQTPLVGQDTINIVPKKIYTTKALGEMTAPDIDGVLNDPSWDMVSWASDYIENQPDENTAPTYQTKFKILYDKRFLYIGVRCYDAEPKAIVKRLSRRDGFEGDWVEFNIDSCLLYTSPSPRDKRQSRMPSSA